MGISTTVPTQAVAISTSTAVYELSQKHAGSGNNTTRIIIVAVVGVVVWTVVVAAGIAVLVWWWFRHHFCKSNTLIQRITDLEWHQLVKKRKIRIVPETAHRTLVGKRVS